MEIRMSRGTRRIIQTAGSVAEGHLDLSLEEACGALLTVLHLVPREDIVGLSKCIWDNSFQFQDNRLVWETRSPDSEMLRALPLHYGSWIRTRSREANLFCPKDTESLQKHILKSFLRFLGKVNLEKNDLCDACRLHDMDFLIEQDLATSPRGQSVVVLWVQGWWLLWKCAGVPPPSGTERWSNRFLGKKLRMHAPCLWTMMMSFNP